MTKRFVEKTGLESARIPLYLGEKLKINRPFVLIVSTYGAGRTAGSVPKPVIQFLNDETNRKNVLAVIGSGNRNYGKLFCAGARFVAEKLGVPLLTEYELLGLPEDVEEVIEKVSNLYVQSTGTKSGKSEREAEPVGGGRVDTA